MSTEAERIRVLATHWKVTLGYIAVTVTVILAVDVVSALRGW